MNVKRSLPAVFLVPLIAVPALSGTFGAVVPIGGLVADIALDERRGALYIANYTGNRIDVMSTADNRLTSPMAVGQQPGSLALSPNQRFLVVAHRTGVTVFDLDADRQRTLATSAVPLAVAFGNGSRALIATSQDFRLLDPMTGTFETLQLASLTTRSLPVPFATFPLEINQAAAGVSGDGQYIYISAESGAAPVNPGGSNPANPAPVGTVLIRYNVTTRDLRVVGITASPPLGPRVVSVDQTGDTFLAGWALWSSRFNVLSQFPYPTGKFITGTHIFDPFRNVIYAQIPGNNAASTPSPSTPALPAPTPPPAPAAESPVLYIVEPDNLTVRERIVLRENLVGKSVLSGDMRVMYAGSESGVTVMPIGSLSQVPRVIAVQEDLVFQANGCDRKVIVRDIDIIDPGGGNTPFSIASPGAGVRISSNSNVTPAKVRVEVDPTVFQNQKGTVALQMNIVSPAAVNIPAPVRLLINTKDPDQKGAPFSVPGKVVDIIADPGRDRFYVLRQDRNQVLVFDGTTFDQIAVLRTGNTPVQMAITQDRRFLLTTADNSQMISVHDLETLQVTQPIEMPPGHYPRSIAVSNNATLVTTRSVSGTNKIDRIDMEARIASPLPTLGVFENSINIDTALTASPSGSSIFGVVPDGTVILYDAIGDTFPVTRKDLAAVSGAYAALTDEVFVVDNTVLNRSLVAVGKLEPAGGSSSGITLLEGLGLCISAQSATSPGMIERMDLDRFNSIRPTRTVESPVLAQALKTATIGQIGQTILPFTRSLAPLANRNAIVVLSASGFTALPWAFDEGTTVPAIRAVVNRADGTAAVAPGGLITINGQDLSTATAANREMPASRTLGETCLTVNDVPIPLLNVTPSEITAQLPFEAVTSGTMVLRTPRGVSNPFTFPIAPFAPAVFRASIPGLDDPAPAIVRVKNGDIVTLSNPIHPEDDLILFLTGLAATLPAVESGAPGTTNPLAAAATQPRVTLGGANLPVRFAGLSPGEIGVYQIQVSVPFNVATGMGVPLVISQGGQTTSVNVRVVK